MYGQEKVNVDVQIASYISSQMNDHGYVVMGTDHKYLCLMDGVSVVFSPNHLNPWYLTKNEFRVAVNKAAGGIELSTFDLFVLYNLAPNNNMETHVKGLGFIKALDFFAKWAPNSRRRENLSDYKKLFESIAPKAAKKILTEMNGVYAKFAWNQSSCHQLPVPETSETKEPFKSMLSVFLNKKDDKNEFRREHLKNKVEGRLSLSVDGEQLEFPERRDRDFLSKTELNQRNRERREEVAKARAAKAIPFGFADMFKLIKDHRLEVSEALDKDSSLSKKGAKLMKKTKPKDTTAPPNKKPKQDDGKSGKRKQSEATINKKHLKRISEVSTITVGSLSKAVGGTDREPFQKHVLKCVDEIREIGNKARLDGYHFFTEFLLQHESKDFVSPIQVVENLKKFAEEFFKGTKFYEKRMESIKGIEFKIQKPVNDVIKSTENSKKRKREKEDAELKDMNDILLDIVRRVLFLPAFYVRASWIYQSLTDIRLRLISLAIRR